MFLQRHGNIFLQWHKAKEVFEHMTVWLHLLSRCGEFPELQESQYLMILKRIASATVWTKPGYDSCTLQAAQHARTCVDAVNAGIAYKHFFLKHKEKEEKQQNSIFLLYSQPRAPVNPNSHSKEYQALSVSVLFIEFSAWVLLYICVHCGVPSLLLAWEWMMGYKSGLT